jgi:hypothetical protein
MSVPYIAWAFQQRDLTAAQKLVLIALCDRANGERVCFPSFPKIAADCELSLRAVYCAVRHLCDVRGLVAKVTDKQERLDILSRCGARLGTLSNVYRILRPADGSNGHDQTPAKYARVEQEDSPTPANPARVTPAKYARVSRETPAQNAGLPLQNNHQTPAKYAPEPSKEPLREPKTRASAREGGRIYSSFKEGRSPADEPVPTPAQIEAQRRAAAADLAAIPGPLASVLANLGKAMAGKAYAPGWKSPLTRDEQIDLLRPRPKPAYLTREQIAAASRVQQLALTGPGS